MANDVNMRVWTRFSVAALLVAALAGALLGSVLTGAQEQPVAAADDPQPAPRRTAYVDFLSLLKDDQPLARKQEDVGYQLRKETEETRARWQVKANEQIKIRENNLPHTKEYRDAMRLQLEYAKKAYQEELLLEQLLSEELRKYSIERFEELRKLSKEIALARGYNEVITIVRDVTKLGSGVDDFKALQQQLLVSPVIYYEESHDISDLVSAAAKVKWGETITLTADGIEFFLEKAEKGADGKPQYEAAALKRNAEGEIEIRFEQKGVFRITVLDKGEKAAGARAVTRWTKRGLDVGTLDEQGTYTAPAAFPANSDKFDVTVRSAIDPTVEQTVTIRLLDKDGNRKKQ